MTSKPNEMTMLENIYKAIYNECERRLYYPPESNQQIYQKILNAATTLYYNGLKSLKHADESLRLSEKEFTAQRIIEFLDSMHQIITDIDFPQTTEMKIKQLIKNYGLNSDELLIPTPSIEEDYLKTQIILNGIS